jgi:hypothetical protein
MLWYLRKSLKKQVFELCAEAVSAHGEFLFFIDVISKYHNIRTSRILSLNKKWTAAHPIIFQTSKAKRHLVSNETV